MLAFINWAPDMTAFSIFGFPIRWYALCWCVALFSALILMHKLYKKQGLSDEVFEPLFMYCFFGVLIGARLGHCLFYEPSYYLSHVAEMLLPIRRLQDGWHVVGYEGLASHGGVIGLIVAIALYCRKTKMNVMHVLDNLGVIAPLSSACIRIGNLMNSEIVGSPTEVSWGFVFANNGEAFARHPAQLYEAIFYLLLFLVFWVVYRYQSKRVGSGFFFGLCLTCIFVFRFLVEFIKEDQVKSEAGLLLNYGQLLSIPLVIIGIYCLVGGKYCRKIVEKPVQKKK